MQRVRDTEAPVDMRRERSFHAAGALSTITLVVGHGCSVEIGMPFKKSPVSTPSLWEG